MFDLEKAIADWREQMRSGVSNRETLNELESHLRDDIEKEMRTGLNSQQAFELAVERIGGAHHLKCEFAKVNRPRSDILRRLKEFIMGRGVIKLPPLAFAPAAQQTLEFARAEAPEAIPGDADAPLGLSAQPHAQSPRIHPPRYRPAFGRVVLGVRHPGAR